MNYREVLNELENLVTDTYSLWDHNRVGFQWRHYTWNHTKRVRAMSVQKNLTKKIEKEENQ